jgi:hypothetical protein
MSYERLIGELLIGKDVEGSGLGLILRCCHGICLERLRKTTKTLTHDSLSPGRGLNPRPFEYESGMLNTRARRLVCSRHGVNEKCL